MVGVHVLGEAVEVALLLDELLLELNELLLLALADGVILVGLLPSLEGVAERMISTVREQSIAGVWQLAIASLWGGEKLDDLPCAASLGRRAGSTLGHDAGGGGEAAEGTGHSGLAERCSKHGCENWMVCGRRVGDLDGVLWV